MHRLFVLLLASLLGCVALARANASSLPEDPRSLRPLWVGAQMPAFDVQDERGRTRHFSSSNLNEPTVFVFYRGGWSSECRRFLRRLRETHATLREQGFAVYFLSADQPSMLRADTQVAELPFALLSDSDLRAGRAFGVAYKVGDALAERYASTGVDLKSASGRPEHELAVPAIFLVDRTGMIRFAQVGVDGVVQLRSEGLLAAARRLPVPAPVAVAHHGELDADAELPADAGGERP